MKEDPLFSQLASLARPGAPESLQARTRRRALARVGQRPPSALWEAIAHAVVATACLVYLVSVFVGAGELLR